jgi:hypothetical protein
MPAQNPQSASGMMQTHSSIIVGLGLLASGIAGLGDASLGAAAPPSPTVNIRRNPVLVGKVWPADFNGDGITDLAGSSLSPDAPFDPPLVTVLLGRGDGTYGAALRTNHMGSVLSIGDFNGDGKVDVIEQRLDTDEDMIALAGNGDGTFGAAGFVTSTFHTFFALSGDIDGDGKRDVVVACDNETSGGDQNQILVIRGNGDLTFDWQHAAVIPASAGARDGTIADLDGDGLKEIVIANHDAQSLTLLRNTGAFTFATWEIGYTHYANDVVAADVNGDERLDLIVAGSDSGIPDRAYHQGVASVLMGTGRATFAGPVDFPTAPGAWQVVVGDFNRDGIPDIATANNSSIKVDDCGFPWKTWDSLSILPGIGDGTFAAASNFSIGNQRNVDDQFVNQNQVWSLNTSDVNGDHATDLIVSSGTIVLNQPTDPNWAPKVDAGPDRPANADHSVTLRAVADDVDQDMLTYRWIDSGGESIQPVPNPCFTPHTLGVHTFTVTVSDGHGHTASDSVVIDFGGTGGGGGSPVRITFTSPASGETVPAHQPYVLRWTTSSTASDGETMLMYVSTDGGATSTFITECNHVTVGAHQCTWNNPNPPTEQAYVWAATRDADVPAHGWTGLFKIRAATGGGGTGTLPSGWLHADVGSVGAAGATTVDGSVFEGDVFTVSASGADIWGTADEFHYVWKSMGGNFEINTRVGSVDAVNAWTKAGLMVRANATDAASPHVSLFATPGKGIAFQRRTTEGGSSISTAGPAYTAPVYLRLVRDGVNFFAYYRKNPTDAWTLLAQQTTSMGSTVDVGVAVTSHADGSIATAKFRGVRLAASPAWSTSAIGAATGSASITNGTTYTVKGSGADIWGTSDALEYLWVPFSGSGRITARVLSVQNAHPWTKAGVMIRESLAADAKQIDGFITPGKGFAMQYRSATGGTSVSAGQKTGTAPAWVQLERVVGPSSDFIQAYYSTDLQVWRLIGQLDITLSKDIYIGLAVSSHNAGVEATATFDDVRIDRY